MVTEKAIRSWGRPGGDCVYCLVNDADVDDEVLRAVKAGVEFASAHLRIATPSIGFYVPETAAMKAYRAAYGVEVAGRKADWLAFAGPKDRDGHADRTTHTIGVQADLEDVWYAVHVATHECCHLAQAGRDRDANEEEAEAYGVWAADVLVRGEKVRTVHRYDGFPYDGYALAGVADHADVVVANDGGKVGVFRNARSRQNPEWVRHHATSPVDD